MMRARLHALATENFASWKQRRYRKAILTAREGGTYEKCLYTIILRSVSLASTRLSAWCQVFGSRYA